MQPLQKYIQPHNRDAAKIKIFALYILSMHKIKTWIFCVMYVQNAEFMLNTDTRYHIPHHIGTKQCSSVLLSSLHLHHPAVQPQHSSSLDDTLVSGKVVHSGFQVLDLPIPSLACPGKQVAFCPMCCIRAALVGGRASIALPLMVNNSQRASSIIIIIDDGASAIVEYIGVGMGEGEGLSGPQPPPPPPPPPHPPTTTTTIIIL